MSRVDSTHDPLVGDFLRGRLTEKQILNAVSGLGCMVSHREDFEADNHIVEVTAEHRGVQTSKEIAFTKAEAMVLDEKELMALVGISVLRTAFELFKGLRAEVAFERGPGGRKIVTAKL